MAGISYYIKRMLLLVYVFALPLFVISQNKIIENLEGLLKTEKKDSVRSLILIDLASNYSGYDTLKARQFFQEANRINRANNWDYNWGYYNQWYSSYLYERGLYDKSLQVSDTALFYFKKLEKSSNLASRDAAAFQVAETVMGIGVTYGAMENPEEALKKYQESLRLFEASNNPQKSQKMATVYNSIATVFFLLDQYEKGLEYDLKSIPYHLEARNEEMLAYAYTYVASDYMRLQEYDSAKWYFDKADPIVTRLNKNAVNIEYYGKVGEMYWSKKDWKTTRKYYTIAYQNAQQINNPYSEVEYLWGIGACLYYEGNYTAAEKFLLQAKELALKNHLENPQREMFGVMAHNYYKLKKYKLAFDYLFYYKGLRDSVDNLTLKRKIAEMDEQFQSQKRQQVIVKLEKDKQIQALSIRQKSTLNYILIGSVAILLIVVFLGYRNLLHRRQLAKQQDELQQQRIRELEKDKQLIAVDSMLKGQEEERSRLAKDLHDGLGGLLSGVKFSLRNMKDNLIITPDNTDVFERSLDMIDTSIKELRRVAHNLMPEMLTKFGLDEALKEYCNTVNATQLLTVKYQSFGMDFRLENSMEIIVYRIVQELLNNILKHAAASEAFVQLIREGDRLSIVVEDNGRGFDTPLAEHSKGAGWINIRSRVEYLKGQVDIHSEPGRGTLVTIEFTV